MKKLFVISLFLVLGLVTFSCKKEAGTTSETETVNPDLLEKQVVWLKQRLAEERWKVATTGQSDSLAAFGSLYNFVLGRRSVVRHLQQWARQEQDEELRRKAELMLPLALRAYVDSDRQIKAVRDSLLNSVYSFRPFFEGQPHSRDYLTGRMMQDADRAKRELAYRSLMTNSADAAELMGRLFRMRNQVARGLGYNNYFDMVRNSSAFTAEDYTRLLDTLKALTDRPYRAFTDQVRKQFATADIQIWDLPYQYSAAYAAPNGNFPADSVIRFLGRVFVDLGFDVEALPVYLAEVTGTSIDAVPAVSMVRSAPIDQRVVINPEQGLAPLEQIAEVTGRMVASSQYNQRERIFGALEEDSWQRAIEQIFNGIIQQKELFLKEARVPEGGRAACRNAFRIKNLIDVRFLLVQLKFEYEAYQNPNRDLNQLYWDIFSDYLYLPRHDDVSPWAMIPEYVMMPAESHQFVLGDLIAWQTLSYLNETTGRDLTGEEARAFLVQNYFRFGSRFSWPELLKRGTGESLRPEYVLAYIPD